MISLEHPAGIILALKKKILLAGITYPRIPDAALLLVGT